MRNSWLCPRFWIRVYLYHPLRVYTCVSMCPYVSLSSERRRVQRCVSSSPSSIFSPSPCSSDFPFLPLLRFCSSILVLLSTRVYNYVHPKPYRTSARYSRGCPVPPSTIRSTVPWSFRCDYSMLVCIRSAIGRVIVNVNDIIFIWDCE